MSKIIEYYDVDDSKLEEYKKPAKKNKILSDEEIRIINKTFSKGIPYYEPPIEDLFEIEFEKCLKEREKKEKTEQQLMEDIIDKAFNLK
jgi:hypothetical protein